MTFGEKIRYLRKKKSWTQKELADRLGLSTRTIVSYEGGQSYPKSRSIYEDLSQIFDVDVNYLYMEDEDEETGFVGGPDQAQDLIRQLGAMFAGGDLSEADKDAVMRAIQDAYWDAKRDGHGH